MRGSVGLRLIAALAAILWLLTPRPAATQEKKYTGPLPCAGECHQQIFDTWKVSRHANAFKNLAPGEHEKGKKEAKLKLDTDYRGDKSCMPCHTTGWKDGGYSLENPDPYFMGVGCEACHGPAGAWNELHQKKDLENRERKLKQKGQRKPLAGRPVCVSCHEDDTNPFMFRTPPGKMSWSDKKHAESFHHLK